VTAIIEAANVEATVVQRLRTVGDILLDGPLPPAEEEPARDMGVLVELLVRAVQADPAPERVWLLLTAVFGSYPTADDVQAGARFFQLAPTIEATLWLLDRAVRTGDASTVTYPLEIVTDRVVVDVDHSACNDLHTGIQQVVRNTLPLWDATHSLLPVAWTAWAGAWRTLSGTERNRAMRRALDADGGPHPETPQVLIVPWRTVVVLLETPPSEACERLAALAQYSGNAVVAVGYDCVPIVSADLVPPAEPKRFGRYLTILKYAQRVAGISSSATVEFGGFCAALPAQGLRGPTVVSCVLPTEAPLGPDPDRSVTTDGSTGDGALVLCVGSLEPRKNHLAVLYAAERLWREGLDFDVLFIAGSCWGEEIPSTVARLRDLGRPISTRSKVADSELWSAYEQARFTVFTSLHEGYGLPVAESLAHGTPVITTDYGSTADIAAGGGALLVDPRDDEALVEAMRRLLTDDQLLHSLQTEISTRPKRTWDQYASELWDLLVAPELPPHLMAGLT